MYKILQTEENQAFDFDSIFTAEVNQQVVARIKNVVWSRREELNLSGRDGRTKLHHMIHNFFKNKKKEARESEEAKEERLLLSRRAARVTSVRDYMQSNI